MDKGTQVNVATRLNDDIRLSDEAFICFQELIYQEAGIFMSDVKRSLVAGRLSGRIRELALPDYMAYYNYIAAGDGRFDGELQRCIDRLTTNETYFFREPRHFEFIVDTVLPHRNPAHPMRIWSAASSSGEEAYTLAMILADKLGPQSPWEIYATDISTRVLANARQAIYPEQRATNVPPEYRRRFIMRGQGEYSGRLRIVPELRKHVHFEHYNLVKSPIPIHKFDIIFCRNVLIYFNAETKRMVTSRLVEALSGDGYLITGHSETLHGIASDLKVIQASIYQKTRPSHG